MSPRPIIFISAVTKELSGARQLVANTLQFLGYEPEWQDIFCAEEGDLRETLRRHIDRADGVLQIVGCCYGAEPPVADPQFGRVSYTQFEALYARDRDRKVWYLLLDPAYPADPHDPEPEEVRALQEAYRQRLCCDGHFYHPLKNADALEARVLRLRDDLGQLRRGIQRWALAVIVLLAVSVGIGVWQMTSSSSTAKKLARDDVRLASMEDKMNALLKQGLEKFPEAEAQVRQEQPDQKPAAVEDKTYTALAKQLGISSNDLRKKLPDFAKQVQHDSDATLFDRANASYLSQDYAEAERLALNVADEAQKAAPPRVTDAIKALELAGWSAEKRIQYSHALKYFRAAEKLTDKKRDFSEWARVQHAVTWVLHDQGKYHEAEGVLRTVAAECTQVLGPENPDTLRARHYHARALLSDGQFHAAELEYRQLIPLREKVLGPENPDTLLSRNNLAATLHEQGQYAEAEAECRAVLAIQTKVLGPNHQDTLTTRNNLANALYDEGKPEEAKAEFRAVLAIEPKVLGSEHPDTLTTRHNFATMLKFKGEEAEAEAEFRAVLDVQTKVLGPDHPDTLMSRQNLATVLKYQGKDTEAEEEFRAVLLAQTNVLGAEHPTTLRCQDNLANVLYDEKKFAEAEAQFRAVYNAQAKVLGPEHPDTLLSRSDLANALHAQGKDADAEKEFRSTLDGQLKVLGPDSEDALSSRNNLAVALQAQGKTADAETQYREVFAERTKVLGAECWDTLEAEYRLATCLKARGNMTEAREHAHHAAVMGNETMGDNDDTKKYQKLWHELQNNP